MSTLVGALIGALLAGGGAAGSAPTKSQLAPLASAEARERVRGELAGLGSPVRLVVVTREGEAGEVSRAAIELATGIAELAPQVSVEALNLDSQAEKARGYRVERAPAIVVASGEASGIRFYGVPGGRELESLLAAIKRVSSGDSGLSEASRKALAGLKGPAHVEVFVTLSCVFCPRAVETAQRLAVESQQVTADMVDATVFPGLADARGVRSVPAVFVNGKLCFVGAKSEEEFVEAVLAAVPKPD